MPKGSDPPPQPSKAKWKYRKANSCDELSIKLQSVQDTMERQNNAIVEILAEHKVLLLEILSQNKVVEDIMRVFPVKSEEKLSELNVLVQSQPDLYSRRMASLLKGKVGRYLNEILGHNIIYNFNVDGTHGKQSLKKFESFYSSLIDAIAVSSDQPDAALRKAFQLQKKRIFKDKSLLNLKRNENESTDNENIENDACM